ncbi:Lrp/AsnC family transcriptional regulator [Niveibacterium umoris]|uniref:DNA-binding Lrp family transcriptional regulator n=1 Tax=Niveibacterium umoris TaxID=1193620 RepID=A0A840BKK8_9RHOO|nr:Lrp/AsnC family transcriptional regulator [Niveibacterium umoris]MBB4013153.1 DNA-binding Lrp family transcriptional regulator [Niveibacterium umoris]
MNESDKAGLALDATELRILEQLQRDAALTNHALAEQVHVSPATCLRRVRRLVKLGVIERQVAILSPDHLGAGLTAIVEVTLETQSNEQLTAFEAAADSAREVQQCYRVSSGPDFVLILQVADMAAYQAAAHRLFAGNAHVRNVRTFFSLKRSKFSPAIHLPPAA